MPFKGKLKVVGLAIIILLSAFKVRVCPTPVIVSVNAAPVPKVISPLPKTPLDVEIVTFPAINVFCKSVAFTMHGLISGKGGGGL
ncbi:MAG: hypothetical protein JXA16_13780 [Bacteroidales bacterium]|nr:hypothetical protein [Bacteroidales bacterium]